MTKETKAPETEEKINYEDDEILTPENKKILKSLDGNDAWEIMKKVIEELSKTAEDEVLKQAKAFSAVKSHGYTIFEIQGAWIDGLNKPIEILDAILHEGEVKEAVDEVNKAEEQLIS